MKGINKIFIGFIFLTLCMINFMYSGILFALIGTAIIATGLWQLKIQNEYCKIAFIFALVNLGLQIFSLLLSCSIFNYNGQFKNYFPVFSLLITLIFMFSLFKGLEQIALSLNLLYAAQRMMKCFNLYIMITAITIFATLFPNELIIIVSLIICFLLKFTILIRLHRFNNVIKFFRPEIDESRLSNRFRLVFWGTVICTALALLLVLKISNAPPVETVLYNKTDIQTSAEITQIKSKMAALGFYKDVLADLPNSEILKYNGIKAFHKTNAYVPLDGGKLILATCVSTLQKGNMRFLVYYKWLEQPKHNYTDLLKFWLTEEQFTGENNFNHEAICLFDKNRDKNLSTYKMLGTSIGENNFSYVFKISMQNTSHKNQRGYIAFSAFIVNPGIYSDYRTNTIYVHQQSIFNIPYKNIYKSYQNDSSFSLSNINQHTFYENYSYSTEEYNP